MKRVVLTIFALIFCLIMCGCKNSSIDTSSIPYTAIQVDNSSENIDLPVLFQMEKIHRCKIASENYIDYYRDTTTDVMYVCFEGYRKGGLTEMHDPQTGLPLTYTRYMEIHNIFEAKE